jgi:hypothetical protein
MVTMTSGRTTCCRFKYRQNRSVSLSKSQTYRQKSKPKVLTHVNCIQAIVVLYHHHHNLWYIAGRGTPRRNRPPQTTKSARADTPPPPRLADPKPPPPPLSLHQHIAHEIAESIGWSVAKVEEAITALHSYPNEDPKQEDTNA